MEVYNDMLIACDKNSKRIEANIASKNEKYYCPKCGAEVLLKKGKIKIPHFAHNIGGCGYGTGESLRHMELKLMMKKLIKKELGINVELEYPINDLISDGFFMFYDKSIAVEIIVHNDNLEEILNKTYEYTKEDIYTLWLWDYNIIAPRVDTDGRVKYKQSMKTLQTMGYGKLNMIGDNNFIVCHSGKTSGGFYGTPMKRYYSERWLSDFFRLNTYIYKPKYTFDKYCERPVKLCGFKIKKWW